jgi:hydroxyacylglutathione hydrolase
MDRPEAPEIDVPAVDGLTIKLGASEFQMIETPGHTRGSICLFVPQQGKLIAGDTLFRNTVGRTDLPGGDSGSILKSIKTRLLDLPEETVVIPGHGANTTIGTEKERNPFLRGL